MPLDYKEICFPLSDHNEMSDTQLRAYGYMAEAMALFLLEDNTATAAECFPGEEPVFYHYHQGAFEQSSSYLMNMGILEPFDDDQGHGFPCCFKFKCSADEFRTVALRNWKSGPPFESLLLQFCDLVGGYDSFNLEHEKLFSVDERYRLVMECLVALGYAKSTNDGFIWTLQFLSYAGCNQNWIGGQKANAAIAKLPDDAREKLFVLMKQGHGINAVGLFRRTMGTSTEIASFAIELMYSELSTD